MYIYSKKNNLFINTKDTTKDKYKKINNDIHS